MSGFFFGGSGTVAASTSVAKGDASVFGDGTFFAYALSVVAGSGSTIGAANQARSTRFVAPKTGTLTNLDIGIVATSGNVDAGIYDTGDSSSGNRTRLWHSGSTACGAANAYQAFTPNLAVTAGVQYDFMLWVDNNTASFLRGNTLPNIAHGTLNSTYDVVTGGASPKMFGIISSLASALPTTIAEASVTNSGWGPFFVAKIT